MKFYCSMYDNDGKMIPGAPTPQNRPVSAAATQAAGDGTHRGFAGSVTPAATTPAAVSNSVLQIPVAQLAQMTELAAKTNKKYVTIKRGAKKNDVTFTNTQIAKCGIQLSNIGSQGTTMTVIPDTGTGPRHVVPPGVKLTDEHSAETTIGVAGEGQELTSSSQGTFGPFGGALRAKSRSILLSVKGLSEHTGVAMVFTATDVFAFDQGASEYLEFKEALERQGRGASVGSATVQDSVHTLDPKLTALKKVISVVASDRDLSDCMDEPPSSDGDADNAGDDSEDITFPMAARQAAQEEIKSNWTFRVEASDTSDDDGMGLNVTISGGEEQSGGLGFTSGGDNPRSQ